jgi:hypothetical protein
MDAAAAARHPVELAIGSHVRLLTPAPGHAFTGVFRGLYRVLERLSDNTYRIFDVHNSRETRAHVSAMRPADLSRASELDDFAHDLPSAYYVVEAILAHQHRSDGLWLKVHWRGYGPESDSWIPFSEARNLTVYQRYLDEHPALRARLHRRRRASARADSDSDDA